MYFRSSRDKTVYVQRSLQATYKHFIKSIQKHVFFQRFISTLRRCRALSKKNHFLWIRKNTPRKRIQNVHLLWIFGVQVPYTRCKTTFQKYTKIKIPLFSSHKIRKKHKKSKKIIILKKKLYLFWKHTWKQVNFSDQKWEFTCFWWTQMLLNGEKTESWVCKYRLLQVMRAIEESNPWSGQSEKKRV